MDLSSQGCPCRWPTARASAAKALQLLSLVESCLVIPEHELRETEVQVIHLSRKQCSVKLSLLFFFFFFFES